MCRFLLGSITDIHVFDLQFPLYPSLEAKMDRIERRREHIRTVSIYGTIFYILVFIVSFMVCFRLE
jgi:hypothetical protein